MIAEQTEKDKQLRQQATDRQTEKLIKSLFIFVNVYFQTVQGKVLNFGFTFKQIILGSFLEQTGNS